MNDYIRNCNEDIPPTVWALTPAGVFKVKDGHFVNEAPTRASTFPKTAAERKEYPVGTGFMDYFPDAIVAVSHVSYVGSQQHNPGQPTQWDRSKSTDEADAIQRHYLERGTLDTDGLRHSAKLAWRAMALLQKELEEERNK